MGPSKLHTQLQFNRNVPSIPDNLAIRYSGPRPIIIEKLRPPGRASAPGLLEGADPQASVPFSVVSEEKLNVAVHLARRDVRRKQLENLVTEAHAPRFPQGQGQAQARGIPKSNLRRNEPTKKPRGPFPARQQTSHVEMADPRPAAPLSPCPEMCSQSDSPPTHDPGSQVCAQPAVESRSMLELRRLQKELSACIQRMEKVAAKDGLEEDLEPDKAERSRVRRQEQTIRTARVLYGLQQQHLAQKGIARTESAMSKGVKKEEACLGGTTQQFTENDTVKGECCLCCSRLASGHPSSRAVDVGKKSLDRKAK